MTQTSTSNQAPKKSSGKNCVVWAVLGCAGLGILAAISVFGIIAIVFGSMKNSGAYQQALQTAQDDPRVRSQLGEPIEAGWWMTGSINVSGTSGEADITFPIEGPQGTAKLNLSAEKRGGNWEFSYLTAQFEDGSEVDLLQTPGDGPMDRVVAFLKAAAEGRYETAHAFFSRPLQEAQPYDVFRDAAVNNPQFFQISSHELTPSQGSDGPAIAGKLTLTEGSTVDASFEFIREDGLWRLISYSIGNP